VTLDIIILCGGQGSRIRSVLGDTPKILAPINGKVFIDYILAWLRSSFPVAPSSIYLSTGIGHDKIEEYVKSASINCNLSREESPLGTFGAVIDVVLQNNLTGNILVLNGDTIFDVDFNTAYNAFNANLLRPLLFVKPAINPSRYGGYRLVDSALKLASENPEYISLGAFYCTAFSILELGQTLISDDSYLMLDRDFLDKVSTSPYVLPSDIKFIDIGVPSDYSHAQSLLPSIVAL
jgi:D-glycero-alpha-D-manno-heptose 1-phosphate guanylyltransferase